MKLEHLDKIHFRYWDERDFYEVSTVSTFPELAPIAQRIMLRHHGYVRILSGPLTSGGRLSVSENIDVFRASIEYRHHEEGIDTFSQMGFECALGRIRDVWRQQNSDHKETAFEIDGQKYCRLILTDFYDVLFQTRDIAGMYKLGALDLLPGWQTSIGARHEVATCQTLGIPYHELDDRLVQRAIDRYGNGSRKQLTCDR